MLTTARTFNTHNINDGADYRAYILNPNASPQAKPVYIDQPQADSDYSGMYTVDVRTVILRVQVLNYADRHTLIAQLKAWFKRGTSGDLVSTFAVDSLDYFLPCVVVTPPVYDGDQTYTIVLNSGSTAWRAVDPDSDTWNVTGAGGTHSLDVQGDDETALSVTVTGTGLPANAYLYQNLHRIVPPNGISYRYRAWRIVMDTATLVAAGKMQANCDDLRVFLGEQETRRWIVNPNNANTAIWFSADFRTGFRLALGAAIAGAGDIAYIQFKVDATHTGRIAAIPNEGIVYHGTEWFSYKGKDIANCRLMVKKRGIFNTTLQAHSVGDNFDFIPVAVRVVYGNPGATSPAAADEWYDETKPIFNLSSSDNGKWIYDATTGFYNPLFAYWPGTWIPSIKQLGLAGPTFSLTKFYTITQDGGGGAPVLGSKIGIWVKGAGYETEQAELTWRFYSPGGIFRISATGKKYRSGSPYPETAEVQSSIDAATWTTLFSEASPASANTWTAWAAHTNVAVTDTHTWVQMIFSGTFPGGSKAWSNLEALTFTVEFTVVNIPSDTALGETSNFQFDFRLTNNANGDAISLIYPGRLNKDFVLDGEAFTAEYDQVAAHRAIALDNEGRNIWIRLRRGTNELALSAVDIGAMTVELSYYRRRL